MEADEEESLPLNLPGDGTCPQVDLYTAAMEALLGLPVPGFLPAACSPPLPPPPAQGVDPARASDEEKEDQVPSEIQEQVAQWRAFAPVVAGGGGKGGAFASVDERALARQVCVGSG
eukprot:TRINITY_DN2312_c0_g1_i4.p4 TRINITY_DN2312_c0_g1~~TRINITY_DN2312_c0_g1_i4.p4  ORF type:complete len:117 (-),score=24.44 TRINITY_DN2312_c0_g1_i4:111-461(-)